MTSITKDFKETTTNYIGYQMSLGLAKAICASHKKNYKRFDTEAAQKLLCDYVNKECGLRGLCVVVKVS